MAVELATAYVSLVVESSKIAPAIRKEFGQVEKDAARTGDRAGKSMGSRMSSVLGKTVKGGAVAIGAGVAAAAGTALVKGFGRLKAIDIAKSQLRGLKLEGEEIESVMKSATKAVTGTAYGLDSAAGAAAGALGAGVEQGKELTKYLTLIGDATTQSTTDFKSMALMLNKVEGQGKLSGDVLQQMAENGLQVMPMLTKEYGKNAGELKKMVSEGEISSKDFRRILKKNIGGAAQESGKTFSGAMDNMIAALGRVGAKFLGGVFEQMPEIFGRMGDSLDKIGPFAESAGDALGGGLAGAIETIGPHAKTAAKGLGNIASVGWKKITNGVKSLRKLTDLDFGNIDGRKLGEQLAEIADQGLDGLLTLTGKVTSKISEMMSKVDWAGIGIEVGKQAPALMLGLTAGVLSGDAMNNLMSAIGEHWKLVLLGALSIALAPAKLVAPLAKILGRIPFVGSFLAASVRWFNQLGGRFTAMLGGFFQTAWRNFTKVLNLPGSGIVRAVLGALKALPGRLKRFHDNLALRLFVWADDAFAAIGRGAGKALGGVLRFVVSIPGRILRALGSLAQKLFPKGSELISGMARGITGRMASLLGYVKGIPGRLVSGVGDLGEKLYHAGRSLIGGLLRGIADKAKEIPGAMGKVAGKIGGFFPSSPIKEGPLRSWNNGGAGKRLIDQLVLGINTRSGEVGKASDNVARQIATGYGSPLSGAPAIRQSAISLPTSSVLPERSRLGATTGKGAGLAINIGEVRAHDYGDFMGQMQAREQRMSLGGVG